MTPQPRTKGRRDRKVDPDPPLVNWVATGPDYSSDYGKFFILVNAKTSEQAFSIVVRLLERIGRDDLVGFVEVNYYPPNGSILYQNVEPLRDAKRGPNLRASKSGP